MPPILVDIGPLYAMADRDDGWHHRVVRFLKSSRDALVVPVTVLPEAAHLLAAHLGPEAERTLVQSVVDGEITVEELTLQDLRRALDSSVLNVSTERLQQNLSRQDKSAKKKYLSISPNLASFASLREPSLFRIRNPQFI